MEASSQYSGLSLTQRPQFFENPENNEFGAIAYYFIKKFYNWPPSSAGDSQQQYQFPLLEGTRSQSDEQLKEKFEKLSKRFTRVDDDRIGIDGTNVVYTKKISRNIDILIERVGKILPKNPLKEEKIDTIAKRIFLVLATLGTVALHFIGGWEFSIPVTCILLIPGWQAFLYPELDKKTHAAYAFFALKALYPKDWKKRIAEEF